ncbi:hypothetical protein F4859DRAFT_474960 [Xylaria cf. heliscus]|nr:hypothetical protein F4859DRAFT_474960 [Xylaria cf. heliscus]
MLVFSQKFANVVTHLIASTTTPPNILIKPHGTQAIDAKMSVIARAGARLNSASHIRRLPASSQVGHQNGLPHVSSTAVPSLTTHSPLQKTITRNISWMAFEMPDPALYQAPPSLQPKRPVAAEAVPSADGTSPSAQPITMAGRVVAPQSAVVAAATGPSRASAAATGKVVPASVPASAMRTGPVPLSQIQKRTITGSDSVNRQPSATTSTTTRTTATTTMTTATTTVPRRQETHTDNIHFPTLQLRIPGHPATWPVQPPEFPRSMRDDED